MNIPKKIFRWRTEYVLVFALAIALFPTRFMLFSWPLLFGLALFILCRNKLGILALLLGFAMVVPIASFGLGIRGYITQTGSIGYMGDIGSNRIHPELRCEISMIHDSIGIGTWLWPILHLPKNIALAGCIRMFGKFPGSYLGPFPNKKEAIQLLSKSGKAVTTSKGGDGLIINGKEYQLSNQFVRSTRELLLQNPNSVIGTVVGEQCLVIGLYYDMDDFQPWIYILELSSGKRLARYIVRQQ